MALAAERRACAPAGKAKQKCPELSSEALTAARNTRGPASAQRLMRRKPLPFHAADTWNRAAWQRTAACNMLDCGKSTAALRDLMANAKLGWTDMFAAHMRARHHQVHDVRRSALAMAVATPGGDCSRKGAAQQNL